MDNFQNNLQANIQTITPVDNMKKAFLTSLICAVLMVVAFLMPFTSATKDYRDNMDRYEDTVVDEELNLTYGDMKHLNLAEYARIYFVHRDMFSDEVAGIVYLVTISAIGLFTILTLIKVLRKKPVGAIVFDIFTFAGVCLMRWDFLDRGVVPSSRYNWGIGIYLYYIAMVALFVSCIWLGREKKKTKC